MNRIFFHSNSHKIFFWSFLFCFLAQIFFWKQTEKFRIVQDIVPEAPTKRIVSAISFGDNEFLFRALALRLQNSGDVFAGFVSLKNYDYARVYQWMKILDNLDDKSDLVPNMATYYYASINYPPKVKYMVDYLEERGLNNPEQNWRYLGNASLISRLKLNDLPRAQKISKPISLLKNKEVPLIYRQIYAINSELLGQSCIAYGEMKRIYDSVEKGEYNANSQERAFLKYYLEYRAYKMDNGKFNPKKCRSHPKPS